MAKGFGGIGMAAAAAFGGAADQMQAEALALLQSNLPGAVDSFTSALGNAANNSGTGGSGGTGTDTGTNTGGGAGGDAMGTNQTSMLAVAMFQAGGTMVTAGTGGTNAAGEAEKEAARKAG